MGNRGKMFVFAPLKNFSYEGDGEINLDKDLKIMRLAPAVIEEVEEVFARGFSPLKPDEIENIRNHFNLYKEVFVERETSKIRKAFGEAEQKFNDVVNALILFKEKNVWIEVIYGVIDDLRYFTRLSEEVSDEIRTYKVTEKEVREFKQWWTKFCKVLKENIYFKRALERFSETGKKARRVDYHLVDCIIGLESLFSEGPGDLRYKVSRRTAVFLTKGEMRRIYKNMKETYSLRNAIVHGKGLDYEKINNSYNKTNNYLRNCLKMIVEKELPLKDKKDKNSFLEDLDIS